MTQNSPETKPKTFVMMAATVSGLVLMQILANVTDEVATRSTPGDARGDVTLDDATLPDRIEVWRKQSFHPAAPVDALPEGQYWWTHAWYYSNDQMTANVSFDQADWPVWHELTECYQAIGWTLVERTVIDHDSSSGGNWSLVMAMFQRGLNEQGLLLFSEFYEDGSATAPRHFEVGAALTQELGLGQRLGNRIDYTPAKPMVPHERVLQCQVFVAYRGTPNQEIQQQVQDLHIISRERFRDAWLASRQHPSAAATSD